MSVPYVAGISAAPGLLQLGGYRLTGWIWVMMLCLGPLIYLRQNVRTSFPVWLWAPWFAYVLLSLMWVEQLSAENLQDAAQIITPLVVGIVASSVIRTAGQLRLLMRAFAHCLMILSIAYVASLLNDSLIEPRLLALTACLVGCVYVADITSNPRSSILGWVACLVLAAVTGSRMATLALMVVWSAYPRHRGEKNPLASLTSLFVRIILPVVLGLSLLLIPNLRVRVLGDSGGNVSQMLSGDVEVSGTGRFEVWPTVWQESKRHIVLGWGVGESGKLVPRFWPGVYMPHNDYLRIIFECGFVGLSLFLVAVIGQMIQLRRKLHYCEGEQKRIVVAGYLALVLFMIVSFTENTIVYGVWFMHPMFAMLGAIYGVQRSRRILIRRPRHAFQKTPIASSLAASGPS